MKWDQRVNITFSCNGPVKDNGAEREDNTDHKAPDIENGSADQYDDAHKFHGVAKFKAGLGIVGNGDKGHIQHGFGVEPPGLYRIFSQHDTCDNAEWRSKHVGSVYRCQAQTVNGKFKDEKLPDERNITGSDSRINRSQWGISSVFCISISQVGVRSMESREISMRLKRR